MSDRHICIHGHFYQPPRENPWLERIELQDSAYPYHDWNERITAECYAPNAASRTIDGEGFVTRIVNNYSRISFNFGPTLLHWMQDYSPDTYEAILEADRRSISQFSGHGVAIAQAYNHMILPLANERDRHTQVIWGIRDFAFRFGRAPEGMWLAETAVDNLTLDILARHGIRFTILAPHQARRVRPLKGGKEWQDVSGDRVDPTRPYLVNLPSGRSIDVFFYDGPISRGIAFEGVLRSGEEFTSRLKSAFAPERSHPQLVHIATDGETYGHHHRHGDMALAYALNLLQEDPDIRLTNYGEYLDNHPPEYEAEIFENSAWSCAHGVERWRSDCGCNSGGHAGWNQQWREPLRESLDWLRDRVAGLFEERMGEFVHDPWETRNDYIDFILYRSEENLDRLVERHARRELDTTARYRFLELLEMQRHAMLMFTSCGWFFDELSGIETVQNLQYAGRVIQLAEEFEAGRGVEAEFLERLNRAASNLPEHKDGASIYRKFVKPAIVDFAHVCVHFAVTRMFAAQSGSEQAGPGQVYCFDVDIGPSSVHEAGKMKLFVGRARVRSLITYGEEELAFGVLHWGDHNLNAGAGPLSEERFSALLKECTDAFETAAFPDVLRALDRHFGRKLYTLKSLFRDEQRHVMETVIDSTRSQLESIYSELYTQHFPLMRFIRDGGNPLPPVFLSISELVINQRLRRSLADPDFDRGEVNSLLTEARQWEVRLDEAGLSLIYLRTMERIMTQWLADRDDVGLLNRVLEAVRLSEEMPFDADLWRLQNLYYGQARTVAPDYGKRARSGDPDAAAWIRAFSSLGDLLKVRVA